MVNRNEDISQKDKEESNSENSDFDESNGVREEEKLSSNKFDNSKIYNEDDTEENKPVSNDIILI